MGFCAGLDVVSLHALLTEPGGSIRVQGEEIVGAPQWQQELAHRLADALLRNHQVAASNNGARHQEPAHRIRTVAVKDLGDIRIVAQTLRHFLPVTAEHNAVTDDVLERRAIEKSRRQGVQRVEPAARLTDVLDNEVSGVVGVEPLFVLERIVHLRERHRPGIEPDVKNILDSAHG